MGWPQITMIVLLAASGGVALAKHGQPRDPISFPWWCFSAAIWGALLYAGGFFS